MLSLFTLISVVYNCILKLFITFRIRNSDLTRSRFLSIQNDKNPLTLLLFFVIREKYCFKNLQNIKLKTVLQ